MSDSLTISSVLVAEMGTQSMRITIPIESKITKENKTVNTPVLLDTRAGGNFMNKSYLTNLLPPGMLMNLSIKKERLLTTPGSEQN